MSVEPASGETLDDDPTVAAAQLGVAPPATALTASVASLRDLRLDAADPQRVAAFWAAVLGRAVQDAGRVDGVTPDAYLPAATGGGPNLYVDGVGEPRTVQDGLRIHITLTAGRHVEDLLALGASMLAEPGAQPWWVLADPEGNAFCASPGEPEATNDADAEIAL